MDSSCGVAATADAKHSETCKDSEMAMAHDANEEQKQGSYSLYQTLVKKEYKKIAASAAAAAEDRDHRENDDDDNGDEGGDNDDDGDDGDGDKSKKHGNKRRQNAKRKREERGVVYKSYRYDLQLCPHIAGSMACKFSEGAEYNKEIPYNHKMKGEKQTKCRYTHDLESWWRDNIESKLDEAKAGIPALGSMCPSYASFGWCFAGFRCKFALSHCKRNEQTGKLELLYVIPSTSDTDAVEAENDEQQNNESLTTKNGGENNENNNSSSAAASASAPSESNQNATFPANPKEGNVVKTDFLKKLSRKQYNYSAAIEDASKNEPKKKIDLTGKIYIAPLTTVGNLPFRRLVRSLGAQVTCGEMALARALIQGQASEWAIVRRHECEDIFGVQIAVGHPDDAYHVARLLSNETNADFIDVNLGCPIDLVTDKGMGSALMERTNKLHQIYTSLSKGAPNMPLAFKMRTGWGTKKIAHNLIANFREWSRETKAGESQLLYCAVHGRSRQMRYSKTADWDYIKGECLTSAVSNNIPLIGNGDVFAYTDWEDRMDGQTWASLQGKPKEDDVDGKPHVTTCLIGRGALIKPWLPTEIRERRHWDISASERFDLLKEFVKYGLEHWGSDEYGINTTRRFLLEFLSFGWKYVPVGILEHIPQKLHERTEPYYGRNELETLLSSPNPDDWVEISSRLLGRPPEGFTFTPKHKSSG